MHRPRSPNDRRPMFSWPHPRAVKIPSEDPIMNAAAQDVSGLSMGGLNASTDGTGASIPLLVQGLEGGTRQLNVPANANVDDIQRMIVGANGAAADYKLSFGGAELEPGAALTDTQVIPAYSHATSLLQVIGNGRLEPNKTAEALDSVCGVVRSLSNGVTDVSALCFAASRSLEESLNMPPDSGVYDVGASLNDVFPGEDVRADDGSRAPNAPSGWAEAPSPAALVRRLSKQLPSHFVPEASETFVLNSMRDLGASGLGIGPLDDTDFGGLMETDAPAAPSTANEQPLIADIARLRRERRADGNGAMPGGSNNFAVPDIATQSAAAAASGFGSRTAVVGAGGDSTWMDDVKTTWVSGLLHTSDSLNNTPTGKELRARLDEIDVELSQASGDRSDENESAPSGMDVDSEHSSRLYQSAAQRHTPPAPAPATMGCTGWSPRGGSASSSSPGLRRATKIAPSPVSNLASGLLRGTSAVAQAIPSLRHMPNRRGRKMKNPDMSPEERKRMRKEQKRRSARESRIRKKTMEEGYQHKLKDLISENGTLKCQVNELTNKLHVLQGLLTVTVRPINGTNSLPRPPQRLPAHTGVSGFDAGAAATAAEATAAKNNALLRLDGNGAVQPGLQRSNRQGLFALNSGTDTLR